VTTLPAGAKGKLPFAQTFHTVNNITDRAVVEGRITIDSVEEGSACTLHVEGECVVKISGLGGKVESIIVENLKNAYRKLPDIVAEWMAVRHVLMAQAEGRTPVPAPPVPSPAKNVPKNVPGPSRMSGASSSSAARQHPHARSSSSESLTGSFQSANSDMEESGSLGSRSGGSGLGSRSGSGGSLGASRVGSPGAAFVPAIPPPPVGLYKL
jgi:hypothetical protein